MWCVSYITIKNRMLRPIVDCHAQIKMVEDPYWAPQAKPYNVQLLWYSFLALVRSSRPTKDKLMMIIKLMAIDYPKIE